MQTRNPRVLWTAKPGFRVWQNVRVSPGPGFFKTRVSIPNAEVSRRSQSVNQFINQPGLSNKKLLQKFKDHKGKEQLKDKTGVGTTK